MYHAFCILPKLRFQGNRARTASGVPGGNETVGKKAKEH